MRHPFAVLAVLFLATAPAAAQSLQELPFDKQLTLAKVGDVDAQYQVGLAYETGQNVPTDEAEAARWVRQAALQGKVVVELTIAPDGEVTACRIVSSELKDEDLERKLVSRIKLFRFEAKDVAPITTTKPIDFFPA